jgi:hypothetical protein
MAGNAAVWLVASGPRLWSCRAVGLGNWRRRRGHRVHRSVGWGPPGPGHRGRRWPRRRDCSTPLGVRPTGQGTAGLRALPINFVAPGKRGEDDDNDDYFHAYARGSCVALTIEPSVKRTVLVVGRELPPPPYQQAVMEVSDLLCGNNKANNILY